MLFSLHKLRCYLLSPQCKHGELVGRSRCGGALKFKLTNQSWKWNQPVSGRCRRPLHKPLRKAEGASFKTNFSFFTVLSTAEAQVFGVKFIGLYGTVGFIAIRDFFFWRESDLWSDVWPPAMDMEWSCLSIPFRRRSNGFKSASINGVRMALKSAQETSSRHIWVRKTLFQMR